MSQSAAGTRSLQTKSLDMSSNQENHENTTSTEGCSHVCRNCENVGVKCPDRSNLDVDFDQRSNESKCMRWLEQCSLNSDGESVYSSETSGTTDSNFSEYTQEDEDNISENEDVNYENKLVCVKGG
ncbi:hypothetical protein ILUMI_02022, partial [Ignelater luminosus]